MGTSKVVFNGETLIDVTGDTVTSSNLLTSYTATKADGEKAVGSLVLPTFETQSKTVTPTESQQTVTPDTNIDGLSSVTVNAVSSTYVGTGITRRTATDLSASGLTVTVPKGYYAANVFKTVEDVVDNDPLTISVNGTYTAPSGKGYSPVTVNVQPRKIEGTKVNFFDYDGAIVEQYSAEEFLAMEAMPSNPSHYGLNAQGWNWSLENAKAQLAACPDMDVNIGQMYSTISGATEIDVTLEDGKLSPYLYFAVNGTATIDWGDGSSVDTVTGTSSSSLIYTNHTYANGGNYTISINVVSGTITIKCSSDSNGALLSITNSEYVGRDFCDAITAARIGRNTELNNYAFVRCQNLRYVTIPNSVSSFGTIYNGTFKYCYALKHITIPNNITIVKDGAFDNCLAMESVSLPYGLDRISTTLFSECGILSYVTIPCTVTSIGTSAFRECRAIRKLSIPDSVTSINNQVFYNCYLLESISLPSGVTSITSGMFNGCRSIKTITWSAINSFVGGFGNCFSLQTISSLGNITEIIASMFYYCESMEEIIIPETVEVIRDSAFQGCSSLKTLTIPNSVTSIGNYSLRYCYALMELHMRPTQPPALGSSAITTHTGFIIYVPQGSLEAYQQDTNWSVYASYMQEE